MFDLKNKTQVRVLMALLAVVFVAAAVYVYQTNIVSETFGEEDEDEEEDEDGVEGFGNFASFS